MDAVALRGRCGRCVRRSGPHALRTRSARVRVAHAQVREVSDECTAVGKKGASVMRWAPDAFRPLQESTEAALVELFKKACVFHLANEEVTGCLPLTAWTPHCLAPHCWPLTAGPSLLAPHCWPSLLLRRDSYALSLTPWPLRPGSSTCT